MKVRSASRKQLFLFTLASTVGLFSFRDASAQSFLVGGFGDGIYSSKLESDGKMSEPKLAVKQKLPAFFAFHPKLDVLYAVTETGKNDPTAPAAITAYRFDRKDLATEKTPALTMINTQKIDGDSPCHVSLDATGEFLAVANYTSGSIVVFPVASDGEIKPLSSMIVHNGSGPNKQRQEKAHAHCAFWDPTNRYVLSCDLGADKVFVYDLNRATGKLTLVSDMPLAPGSGPRHLAFHPNGKWVFVVNELNMTLTTAAWDAASAKLKEIQTVSTLPVDAKGDNFSTAEVLVHPSGRFVYSSNRGHHTIASYRVDEQSGKLTPIAHTASGGKTPRNFRITPKGDFLLTENQESDSIFSFRVNMESGKLEPTGFSVKAPAPACIKFFDR
ncbi:MAG: lactonase family protein [Planctomycetota bacterium]|nr:lactonase family protein [Planctomycetota bacterium]